MNSIKRQKVLKSSTVIASIVVLLTAGLAPVFADNTNPSLLAPTNLSATPLSYNQITLTWNSPLNATQSGIIGYQILRNGEILVNNTGNTLTNYNDTGLTPGSIEQYQVAALNGAGIGLFSNNASATTPVPTNTTQIVPQEPDNTTSHMFRGNWTNFVERYHDHHGMNMTNQTSSYFNREHIGQFMNGTSNYVFNGQRNGTYYHYPVQIPSQTAHNFQGQWIQHVNQYQLQQTHVNQYKFQQIHVQQFKALKNIAQIWHKPLSIGIYNHYVDRSIDKHLLPYWMTTKKPWGQ